MPIGALGQITTQLVSKRGARSKRSTSFAARPCNKKMSTGESPLEEIAVEYSKYFRVKSSTILLFSFIFFWNPLKQQERNTYVHNDSIFKLSRFYTVPLFYLLTFRGFLNPVYEMRIDAAFVFCMTLIPRRLHSEMIFESSG